MAFNFLEMPQTNQYLFILFSSSIIICTTVFSINLFFDPLWYENGNQLEPVNYMFNERLSKTNQYLKQRKTRDYNCIIFGSSRTTLFNESLLDEPYRCFNFSFSAGRIKEFIAFAKWIKNKAEDPQYVILGIDDFNFVNLDEPLNIPDFIKTQSNPPNIYYSYLSLDALKMSMKLWFHSKDDPRIYDREFIGTVASNPPQYQPILHETAVKLRPQAIQDYKELRSLFPHSIFLGYVPPISAWITVSKSQKEIDSFLNAVYTISEFVDDLYDFSVPSDVTANPRATYDGSHYFPKTNNEIVRRITGKTIDFGIRVNKLSKPTYIEHYQSQIDQFYALLNATMNTNQN